MGGGTSDLVALEEDLTAGRRIQPRKAVYERALSGAVRADHRGDAARKRD